MFDKLVDHYLNEHHITVEIEFIPRSNCPHLLHDRVNWRVLFIRNFTKQAFCFWQCLDKLQKVESSRPGDQLDLVQLASEHGLQVVNFGNNGIHAVKRLKTPQSIDIIKQLFSIIPVLECNSFEAWAVLRNLDLMDLRNKGKYWTDVMNALKLKTLFSDSEQEELQQLVI